MTPPRFAKKAAMPIPAQAQASGQSAPSQLVDPGAMEVCSTGSGSTEDWASSRSNDDTLEDHV